MEYIKILKEHGLKATPQRLCVLKLLAKHTHPNIDELYEQMRELYPSISLATVYKNLNTLIEKGVIVEVANSGQKSRFDIYHSPHIHVICENCGKVYDYHNDVSRIKEYQEMLEKTINNTLTKLSIVATIPDCECCR